MGSSNCLWMPRASVPEVPGVRIGTAASLAPRHYARAVSTHRIVLVSLLVANACLGLAAAYADGSWRDLWLNLLAGAVGVAFIVLFDVLFERSEARKPRSSRCSWPPALLLARRMRMICLPG